MRHYFLLIFMVFFLAACTANTTFESVEPGVSLLINLNPALDLDQESTETYHTTSFGQYIFMASQEGKEPIYGLLPLKFNGGYLAADILFFAPGLFFNLREVFPYYQFDMDTGELKYRQKETDDWAVYQAPAAEVERAKVYFSTYK